MISTLSTADLREYFPELNEVYTAVRLIDSKKKGVYVLDEGEYRIVKLKGPCPNFQNGDCRLGEKCLSKPQEDITL